MISISSGLSPLYQKQPHMDGVRAKQVIDKCIQLSPTELCKRVFFFLNSKKCKHSDKSSRSSESSTYLKIGDMGRAGAAHNLDTEELTMTPKTNSY